MFTKQSQAEVENKEEIVAEAEDATAEATEDKQEPTLKRDEFNARSVSYIGPGLHLSGEINVDEGLVVEGVVDGDITTTDKSLTVGRQGRVNGNIFGNNVEVRGRVDGEVNAEELVRLFPSAVFEGTIRCKRLVIDDGATFNGKIDMARDAVADADDEDEDEAPEAVTLKPVDSEEPVAKAG